ncbi:DUF1983 domain-containing protein [Escherichia coli]|nr:DUF1983 domain-containing protein [Escherichia coli]
MWLRSCGRRLITVSLRLTAEIRTSITDVSNEITQTVNKKLEDQSAAIQQIQKVQVDTNNNLNSMWAVKLQQMQDGRLYIAGIGAGIENTLTACRVRCCWRRTGLR